MNMQIAPLAERHVKVTLAGRLDTPGADSIETRFLASLIPDANNAIIDMSQVDFISSMGIRMLVSAARSLKMRQAMLAMYGVQDRGGSAGSRGASRRLIVPSRRTWRADCSG